MNLERAEQICLSYLGQADSPLVPVHTLVERCRRDEQCAGMSEQDLLPFLRTHELILVVEGPGADDASATAAFSALGLEMGPRAILKTRIPPPQEMLRVIEDQLEQMAAAITKAVAYAEEEGATEGAAQLRSALERTDALRARMQKLL